MKKNSTALVLLALLAVLIIIGSKTKIRHVEISDDAIYRVLKQTPDSNLEVEINGTEKEKILELLKTSQYKRLEVRKINERIPSKELIRYTIEKNPYDGNSIIVDIFPDGNSVNKLGAYVAINIRGVYYFVLNDFNWIEFVKTQISGGRLIYSAWSSNSDDHAIVVCGYSTSVTSPHSGNYIYTADSNGGAFRWIKDGRTVAKYL